MLHRGGWPNQNSKINLSGFSLTQLTKAHPKIYKLRGAKKKPTTAGWCSHKDFISWGSACRLPTMCQITLMIAKRRTLWNNIQINPRWILTISIVPPSNCRITKLRVLHCHNMLVQILYVLFFSYCTVGAFRVAPRPRILTTLNAVKSSSSDKIRVKLLADVKGTGR